MTIREWTDDDLRHLVELRGKGVSFAEIGRILGRSKDACLGKLRRCVEESDRHEVGP